MTVVMPECEGTVCEGGRGEGSFSRKYEKFKINEILCEKRQFSCLFMTGAVEGGGRGGRGVYFREIYEKIKMNEIFGVKKRQFFVSIHDSCHARMCRSGR
jgi:hypothetical protein